MKTIEERAKDFVNILMSEQECSDLLRELLEQTYIAAATDEHTLMTEWHSLSDKPKKDGEILLRRRHKYSKEITYSVYYYRIGFLDDGETGIIGWREIHE